MEFIVFCIAGKVHKFDLIILKMKFLNKYLRNLKPYKLASHKIWSVNSEERSNILKLDWNEATIPPSPKVKEHLLHILNEPTFLTYIQLHIMTVCWSCYPVMLVYQKTIYNILEVQMLFMSIFVKYISA